MSCNKIINREWFLLTSATERTTALAPERCIRMMLASDWNGCYFYLSRSILFTILVWDSLNCGYYALWMYARSLTPTRTASTTAWSYDIRRMILTCLWSFLYILTRKNNIHELVTLKPNLVPNYFAIQS